MQSKQTIGVMRRTIAVWAITSIYVVVVALGAVSEIALVALGVTLAVLIGPAFNPWRDRTAPAFHVSRTTLALTGLPFTGLPFTGLPLTGLPRPVARTVR